MVRTVLLAVFCFFVAASTLAQTAKVQIIHNAADPAAAAVDIYVNGEKSLENVAFRTSTGFLDLPSGVDISVAIAPGGSSSVGEALYTTVLRLDAGGVYLAIANGVLNPMNFASNSDANAKPIAFAIYPIAGRTQASESSNVDVLVFHGSTDAPRVDVVSGGARVIEGLSYGSATSYLSLPPATYDLGIAPAGGNPVVTYRANLSTAAGAALTVLASGFYDPSQNSNGEAFGLYVVPASGGALEPLEVVPTQQFAQIQVVHNAADPAAALVDVWAGGEKPLLDDFAFRTSSPFVDVPAGVEIPIGVALSTSTSASEALATFKVTLEPGRYIVVANGVLNADGFAANADPDAAPISFNLYTISGVRPRSISDGTVDILVFHGATDAPKVDVLAGSSRIVEGLSYGEVSEYQSVPAASYTIGIAPAGGEVIASFTADVSPLSGRAIAVFASGFLNPEANKNGAAFGLWAALPAGGPLVQLPPTTTSVNDGSLTVGNTTITPNPTTGAFTAAVSVVTQSPVSIRVVDITGRIVAENNLGMLTPGDYEVPMATSNLVNGTYSLVVEMGNKRSIVPIAVLR